MAVLLTQAGVNDRFGARAGVHPAGMPAVSLAGTTITVRDLKAVVYPGITTVSGPYLVGLPSETHELDPADATNPRVDIVVLRVYDDDEDSSGRREGVTEYIVGTAATSPVPPAPPPGAVLLASVLVPVSGSGDPVLTYEAPYTVASGGILPVRTDLELPAGSSGLYDGSPRWRQDTHVLEVYDGAGAWLEVGRAVWPKVRLRLSADQSIPDSSDETVIWNAKDYDIGGGHNSSVNPSRYTAPINGYYRVEARIHWAPNTSGRRMSWLWLNGSSVVGSRDLRVPGTAESWPTVSAATLPMTAGQYVEVRVQQNRGGSLNINGGTSQSSSIMTVEWVGPLS